MTPGLYEIGADGLRIQRDDRDARVRIDRAEHRRREDLRGHPPGHRPGHVSVRKRIRQRVGDRG